MPVPNNGAAESIVVRRMQALPFPRTPDQDEAFWILSGVLMYLQGTVSAVSFTHAWWNR